MEAAELNSEESIVTIDYEAEGVPSKEVFIGDVSSVDQEGIVYLDPESGLEARDYWNAIANLQIVEPSDVVEIDV